LHQDVSAVARQRRTFFSVGKIAMSTTNKATKKLRRAVLFVKSRMILRIE
jgi:hypothetical protein